MGVSTVEPDEVLFSTIDARGNIVEANDAFSRNARLPRKTIAGAHRLSLRQASQPDALPAALWQRLQEEGAVAGLLRSGDDDARYLATWATCLGDQIVVLQMLSRDETAAATYRRIDAAVGPVEDAFRAVGSPDEVVTDAGLAQLEAHIAETGTDLARLGQDMLISEMQLRNAHRSRRPWWEAAPAKHRFTLAEARTLDNLVLDQSRHIDAIGTLTDVLESAIHRIAVMHHADAYFAGVFTSMMQRDNAHSPHLGLIQQWNTLLPGRRASLERIAQALADLPDMHRACQAHFACLGFVTAALDQTMTELASGVTGAKATRRAARILLQLVEQLLPEVTTTLRGILTTLEQIADDVEQLAGSSQAGIAILTEWQQQTAGRLDELIDQLRPEVSDALQQERSEDAMLRHIVERCRALPKPDLAPITNQATALRHPVEDLV